ncbi:hypothetical protein CVT24_008030 [Panaeolus cyanescens]|uniref:Zn(2)-C6 fungal-type domain-containing protein n=1 Tax=Panaeolus cyanescens TaxID=181874 RepID=A0A409YQY9_9AGAR|nr:hypothetical protein CVT24_008030 [Panaeolus cyanescens]
MTPESFQPLQLKGEIMDLEFTIDTDHRKRRRNRTTQSCLNCHTSKRKCDRKRPCQRCIQLGLVSPYHFDDRPSLSLVHTSLSILQTGLCVYEIDDPALRDDPSVDESTRLRNRIAELESLVRELRGKPHPRWAESNFRDGDPNEKWHSRATKCVPLQKRGAQQIQQGQTQSNQQNSPQLQQGDDHRNNRAVHSLLSPIKTEPSTDNNHGLYRFSDSPAPSMRYHTFQADVRSNDSTAAFDGEQRPGFNATTASGLPGYNSSTNNVHYNGASAGGNGAATSSYSDGGTGGSGAYPLSNSDDGNSFSEQFSVNGSSPQAHFACPCRTHPTLAMQYATLSNSLQTSLASARQYAQHHPNSQCPIYRRMVELNSSLHSGTDSPGLVAASYDSGPASDNEIMTPVSASSGHASFHAGSPGVSPQEWGHMASAGYNPYFASQDHHTVYNVNHVMT